MRLTRVLVMVNKRAADSIKNFGSIIHLVLKSFVAIFDQCMGITAFFLCEIKIGFAVSKGNDKQVVVSDGACVWRSYRRGLCCRTGRGVI